MSSPDSQSRDRRTKFTEYQSAGVREYWIIDPMSKTVEVISIKRKAYQPIDAAADGWIISAVLPGFRIKSDMLWQRPLPKVNATLKQMRIARPRD